MKRFVAVLTWMCFLAAFAAMGCSHPAPQGGDGPGLVANAKTFDEKIPPANKEILRSLFASQNVNLTVDASCSGVGVDPADSTIGDYISGFLAEQTTGKGKNWLDISAQPERSDNGVPLWKANVVIRHVDGEDRWGGAFPS